MDVSDVKIIDLHSDIWVDAADKSVVEKIMLFTLLIW